LLAVYPASRLRGGAEHRPHRIHLRLIGKFRRGNRFCKKVSYRAISS
jgi:hypothetical protein